MTNAEKDFVDNSAQHKFLEEMDKLTGKQYGTADINGRYIIILIFHFVRIKQLSYEDLFV